LILYGRNAVREALRGRRAVLRAWAEDERGAADARAAGVPVEMADAAGLEAICGSPDHQGMVCEAAPYPYADPGALLGGEQPLVVGLDQIQDPQNLGAICRSAEGAGASGVVIPERRSAEVTPAVCRASAGVVEHLPVARVRNLADFLLEAKEAGAWVYGADAAADRLYTQVDWSGPAVMVLGSEGKGLRPRVQAACDDLVKVPLRGRVGSLNVAATAAILLFEAVRSRAGLRQGLDKST
jgi:23S rRNA (guanosine2251-2'-O)-methyltransferase